MKHLILILIALGCWGTNTRALAATPRPNILYIYVDDLGWGALGPNGQFERKAKGLPHLITPNLDRLAAEGVNFTRAYGATVCSPARSSQQSGFHQGHTFADRNDPDNAKKAMRSDDVLIGDVLSRAGYVTGYWGKWGFGGSKSRSAPEILNLQTLPTSHGYEFVVAELHHVRAHTFFQPTLWSAASGPDAIGEMLLIPNSLGGHVGSSRYPDFPALQNHADYPDHAYCDDVYAFAALDFVREQAQRSHTTGRPFFALLAVQVPHAPFAEVTRLPEWDRAYRRTSFFAQLPEQAKQWAAMITRIDGHIGNLLDALEDPNGDGDTADSVADNTLVVFQSDNGGPMHPACVEFNANGGLRGAKGQIHEGGIRVPTLMRWPRHITKDSTLKAGADTSRLLDVTDLLPTFCELAGEAAPLGVDGVSIAPTLLRTGTQRPRDFLIHEAGNGQSIIRGRHKLVRTRNGYALYDLQTDPAESLDVADANPTLVDDLRKLLLGERVTEPAGFANSYHHWTGGDGAAVSSAAHWSDYVYANAGITYLTDDGSPRLSWTAHLVNRHEEPALAVVDADVEFLALEIAGGRRPAASQTVSVGKHLRLTGRNEIRVAQGGVLALAGGTATSLRHLDVRPGGRVQGTGAVETTLYNQGVVVVENALIVRSDYRESARAKLVVHWDRMLDSGPLQVGQEAALAGHLAVELPEDHPRELGSRFTLLSAGRVTGRFLNDSDEVVTTTGIRLAIQYSAETVELIVKAM